MNPSVVRAEPAAFFRRWRIYFAERFPPLQHGTLIAAFCFGLQAYAGASSIPAQKPGLVPFAVAFVTTFLLMLQLRILDEFKDFEDDVRWRPYRAVPRGLVSLASLRNLWFIAAALQSAAVLLVDARLFAGLLAIWLYSGLMGVEFFMRRWLKAHPLAYMLSHILIAPMIALQVVQIQLLPSGAGARGLAPLLLATYFAFCVIEVGRKIRAPAHEQAGVETYTALWGAPRALAAWLAFMACASALAMYAAAQVDAAPGVAVPVAVVLVIAAIAAVLFLRTPGHSGKHFNALSGLWVVALFLSLGFGALL